MTTPAGDYERTLSLYANAAGDWCFVESPSGVTPAPAIGDMRYLCHPDDTFVLLYDRIPGATTGRGGNRYGRFPAQRRLAELAGVSQGAVSRYLRQKSRPALSRPTLPNNGWRRISALLFAWTEWADKPVDERAIQEFLSLGGDR